MDKRKSAFVRAAAGPIAGILIGAVALLPSLAGAAEPVRLKLSFFASERTETYESGIKPFVDGINTEGQGLLEIDVYANGALGRGALAEQPGLLFDGVADIAWVVPGQTPYRFPDNQALEMPGLFRDVAEGTLVYTRLVAAGALRGYQDLIVIGAYASAPSIIHSRRPVVSLAALKGLKLRANNPVEAETLERLGALPTVMPAPRLADALAKGSVEGAIMSPAGVFQYGASAMVTNHYLLPIGSAPLVLAMNRKKFDALPDAAKALILKYAGERAAATWIEMFAPAENRSLERIKSEPGRTAVEPSPADLEAARRTYRSIAAAWSARDPRNRQLVERIESELATIRSGSR